MHILTIIIQLAAYFMIFLTAENTDNTEEYIGSWLVKQQRDQVMIATKVAGRSSRLKWIRQGKNQIDRPNIEQALMIV